VKALDLQTIPLLFLFCLPLSVWLWSMVLVASGFVRNIPDMPWELRVAARVVGSDSGGGPSGLAVPVDLFCLAIVNSPVVFAFIGPYGPISEVAAATYVAVQVCSLVRVRRAVRRVDR